MPADEYLRARGSVLLRRVSSALGKLRREHLQEIASVIVISGAVLAVCNYLIKKQDILLLISGNEIARVVSLVPPFHVNGINRGNAHGVLHGSAQLIVNGEAYDVGIRARPRHYSKLTLAPGEFFDYVVAYYAKRPEYGKDCELRYRVRQVPDGRWMHRSLSFDCSEINIPPENPQRTGPDAG